MFPVPGYKVTSPYGRRSFSPGVCGFHTGADIAAPLGARIVAARPGTLVHTSYGSAFGNRQFAIRCDDGTEDFYGHCETRINPGRVQAGQQVGTVGSRGKSTGPHLHFERHTQHRWACSVMTNPQPSIDWQPAAPPRPKEWDEMASKQEIKDAVREVVREEVFKAVWDSETSTGWQNDGTTYDKARLNKKSMRNFFIETWRSAQRVK